MRILVTSDWHLDWITTGIRRFPDLDSAVEETVEAAIDARVDAYWFLGDLVNPDTGSRVFQCIELAAKTGLALKKADIRSDWIAGNHDIIEDGGCNTTLSPLRPLQDDLLRVHEKPSEIVYGSTMRLITLPYVATHANYSPDKFVKSLNPRSGMHTTVAGHLMIPGIMPGTETKEMPRGREIAFPLEACARIKDPLLLMNGHYHCQQVFRNIHIPGSLERLTFNEEHYSPGWLLIEV